MVCKYQCCLVGRFRQSCTALSRSTGGFSSLAEKCPNAKQLLGALVGLQQELLENKRSHRELEAFPKEKISYSKLGGEQPRPHLHPP